MRTEDYRKRNYIAYKEIHLNCVVDTEKMMELTITECMETYIDVVRHLQLKTTASRCKVIIKLFKNNMIMNKWKETSDYDVRRICNEVFINAGYCEATIRQMENIVLSSIRLVRDVLNDSCKNKENKTDKIKYERDKIRENVNYNRITIVGMKKEMLTIKDVKVGGCFMIEAEKDSNVYMKISSRSNLDFKPNVVCINNGTAKYVDKRVCIKRIKLDIMAKVVE